MILGIVAGRPIAGPPPAGPAVWETATERTNASASTSQVADMPSGIAAGDLLVAWFVMNTTGGTYTDPSGWTLLDGYDDPNSGYRHMVYTRVADGSEGSTITLGTSGSRTSKTRAVRISNADGAVEFLFRQFSSGSTTYGFLPITPSWGGVDTLYLILINGYFNQAVTVFPGPDNQDNNFTGDGLSNNAICSDVSSLSSYTPAGITFAGAQYGGAYVIAIKPA